MKATKIIDWIADTFAEDYISILDVPEEGDGEDQQNEEWWVNKVGNYPPFPIPSGKYLYYYESQISNIINHEQPDTQIEIPTASGFDYINLYKIEE